VRDLLDDIATMLGADRWNTEKVVIASQTNMPRSGSCHASPASVAACTDVGGCESGTGAGGV
jgi:hypothetical protein